MKIFVTGTGIISALGTGTGATLQSLLSGESGIDVIRHLSTGHKEFPAGEVALPNEDIARMLGVGYPENGLRTVLLGITAAREAVS